MRVWPRGDPSFPVLLRQLYKLLSIERYGGVTSYVVFVCYFMTAVVMINSGFAIFDYIELFKYFLRSVTH